MDHPMTHGYNGVGATLRAARERGGLDPSQVAKTLRMQPSHLIAIELGRFGELPGQVYALGFVRSYAEYLGFDGDAAVRRLKEEISGEEARQSPLTFPVPVGEARTPGPRLLLFAVVAAAAIYGAWVYWGRVQTGVVELVPPLPERLAKLIGDSPAPAVAAPSQPAPPPSAAATAPSSPATAPAVTPPPAPKATVTAAPSPPPATSAPLPPPPEIASPPPAATSAPAPAPPVAAAPAANPSSPPLVAAAPVGAEVVLPPPPRPPAQAEPPAQAAAALPVPPGFPTVPADGSAPPPAAPVAAATGNVYGVPAAESRVTLRAKSISWVQVRGADNEILITRTLRAGDTYHLPNRPDMVMMTGSAGGLEVLVDGKPVPPLGAAGEVRRNIPLDPEKLATLGR